LDGIAERGQNVGIDADLEWPRTLNVCGNRSHNNSMMAPVLARLAALLMYVWS
jgi:hypothetical protein